MPIPCDVQAAQKGVTVATARYSALRGALSFLGPVMWGTFAVDLALKAIGTDYARVVRAVFLLAQVGCRVGMPLVLAVALRRMLHMCMVPVRASSYFATTIT